MSGPVLEIQRMKKTVVALSALLFAAFAAIGAEPPAPEFLKARVDVEVKNGIYSYTIHNDEPVQSVYTFHLDIKNTPITVVGSPPGWGSETNGKTFVAWLTGDEALTVPPGRSLGGFRIQSPAANSTSMPYALVGWDRTDRNADLVAVGTVLSPSD
jgi:hypothetical protein